MALLTECLEIPRVKRMPSFGDWRDVVYFETARVFVRVAVPLLQLLPSLTPSLRTFVILVPIVIVHLADLIQARALRPIASLLPDDVSDMVTSESFVLVVESTFLARLTVSVDDLPTDRRPVQHAHDGTDKVATVVRTRLRPSVLDVAAADATLGSLRHVSEHLVAGCREVPAHHFTPPEFRTRQHLLLAA